jgi:Pentapeptide repeats (8 copies)
MIRRAVSSARQHRVAAGVLLTGLVLGAVTVAALTLGWGPPWLIILTVMVLALLLGCVFVAPGWIAPPRSAETLPQVKDPAEQIRLADDRLKLQNDIRTALLQAVGGAAVIAGIFFTWQQLQTDRDQLRQQLTLTRQGQVAERFTRVIDQLGSGKLEVQLGGIYGLEQIARQASSDPQSTFDRFQVHEVLTAYIRKHAAWSHDRTPLSKLAELEQRAPDVQAALTVLARRTTPFNDPPLDLHGVDLRRAHAYDPHLEGTDFHDAHLEGAVLYDARLNGAILGRTHLERAYLPKVHLEGALLYDTHLEGANLSDAYLEGALLHGAHLKGADLNGAQLNGAKATKDTVWPTGFDWRAAGVTITAG